MAYSLAQIAHEFSLDYEGDGEITIAGLCGLSDDLEDHLSFVTDRKLLGLAEDARIPPCDVRMGTTLATNALLERKGSAET